MLKQKKKKKIFCFLHNWFSIKNISFCFLFIYFFGPGRRKIINYHFFFCRSWSTTCAWSHPQEWTEVQSFPSGPPGQPYKNQNERPNLHANVCVCVWQKESTERERRSKIWKVFFFSTPHTHTKKKSTINIFCFFFFFLIFFTSHKSRISRRASSGKRNSSQVTRTVGQNTAGM